MIVYYRRAKIAEKSIFGSKCKDGSVDCAASSAPAEDESDCDSTAEDAAAGVSSNDDFEAEAADWASACRSHTC